MKIATITCHDVYNYGASLQAYALQQYLLEQGHDAEIIDYKPYYLTGRYNWRHIPAESRLFPYKDFIWIQCLYFLLKNRKIYATIGRKHKFDEFKRKYLTLSKKTYTSVQGLRSVPPPADLYIAGSDQIWNTSCENGKDAAFYLDFRNKNTRRISYAASFAVSEIDSAYRDFVTENLRRFDAISVRERTGVKIVAHLAAGKKAEQVEDPVFLLDRQRWEEFSASVTPQEKYVLVYDFTNDPTIREHAQQTARRLGVRIYSLNDFAPLTYADRNISDAGPLEFLAWIKNAEFVLSNSFHATAFSVIFHKPFLTYPLRGRKNHSRMQDFLNGLGLINRFNPEQNRLATTLPAPDWDRIDGLLSEKIGFSKRYLTRNVQPDKTATI